MNAMAKMLRGDEQHEQAEGQTRLTCFSPQSVRDETAEAKQVSSEREIGKSS